MLIIVDKKAPDQARTKLKEYGNLLELETSAEGKHHFSTHPKVCLTAAVTL